MESNWESWFKQVTGFKRAYSHQLRVAQLLEKGKAVLLRAPTGSGKTEAVLVPFLKLKRDTLPNKLIYSLPVRALVEDIGRRSRKSARRTGASLSVHHGAHVEDPMLRKCDVLVTTIDQTVAAYVCTPLSFATKHGSIPAGAVATGFLVFDEVQLLDPELGLQAALVLAKHSAEVGIPFVLMSATLPSLFADRFVDELSKVSCIDIEIIDDVQEKDIPKRAKRKVKLFWKDKELNPEEIEKVYSRSHGKMIVICNTVQKAQELFKNLKIHEKHLLHSRFLDQDRKKVEQAVRRIFSKKREKQGVLITTQVIEAGMDISTPLMLTELAPVDSIIQRAGRCARWGGKGEIWVYKTESAHPYSNELVEDTANALKQNYNEAVLTWEIEKEMVDNLLKTQVENKWLNLDAKANTIALLSEAAFTGNKSLASKAVRDEFSCEISLHRNPDFLGKEIFRLERIRVPFWLFRNWAEKYQLAIWEAAEDNLVDDELEVRWRPLQVNGAEAILPFKHYVISSQAIGYDEQLGLIPEGPTKNFPLTQCRDLKEFEDIQYKEEPWSLHARRVQEKVKELLESCPFIIAIFSKAFEMGEEDFKRLVSNIMKLHDLGKLSKSWQDKAGWDGKTPLAHSSKQGVRFPPHATVSAYALSKWACNNYKTKKLYEAMLFAVAHHHSLRSAHFRDYELIENWKEVLHGCDIDNSIIDTIIPKANSFRLPAEFPEFGNPFLYRAYAFISRTLKLADWAAIGGEDALLRIENRYVNV